MIQLRTCQKNKQEMWYSNILEIVAEYQKDENGNITIYVSSVDRTEEIPRMGAIESDEEWDMVEEVINTFVEDEEDA